MWNTPRACAYLSRCAYSWLAKVCFAFEQKKSTAQYDGSRFYIAEAPPCRLSHSIECATAEDNRAERSTRNEIGVHEFGCPPEVEASECQRAAQPKHTC